MLQWDVLESYFLLEFEDNDEIKDDDKVNQEVRLIRKFSDPFTKSDLLFVQSVIPFFDIYHTFLKSEGPLVHLLQESTFNLYRTLLAHFIKSHIITQNDDTLSIYIADSTNYVS